MTESAKILKFVDEKARDRAFQEKYKINAKVFVRNRKLGFEKTLKYILGNARESLEMSRETFCKAAKMVPVSGAALCKAREKIQYTAIADIFEETALRIPTPEEFKGYQVIAIDGMKGEMPKTPELMEKYHPVKGAGYPMFHSIEAYDVLNELYLAADFVPAPANEHQLAISLLEHPCFQQEKQQILLFDRGFPSVELLQALEKAKKKYVMRVSGSFLREVNEFIRKKYWDRVLKVHYEKRRSATSRVKVELPCDLTFRCVRIPLRHETDEFCITNLDRKDFPRSCIKSLYNMRWRIETSFNTLKYSEFLEEFSSKKENGIQQDFYASLWMSNLTSVMILQDPHHDTDAEKKTVSQHH